MTLNRVELCVIEDAILFATTYMRYVREKEPRLHAEADGSPSCEAALEDALRLLAALKAFVPKEIAC